jgi:transcriptional regulator with GAF, ATPase, and Fis domain
MSDPSQLRQRIQKLLGDAMSSVSSGFMGISSGMRPGSDPAELRKELDKLFSLQMHSQRAITAEINTLLDELESLGGQLDGLREEKRRLEALYTSGIILSSETGQAALTEKAIDVVVRELRADAGFIVLVDALGATESVHSRNMDPDGDPSAREMSTTVIRNTIASMAPTRMPAAGDETELSRRQSVLRLGITAVLCVPLVSANAVRGAVYLDRRKKDIPFTEADLVFLLAFARQIVRGIDTSLEITELQRKLVAESTMRFSDLRKDFRSAEIAGSGRALFEVLRVCAKIAPTDAPVILLGENGTGKDLVAHAIHRNSRRAQGPFVTIHCGAIPPDLLESELFGYESGAFTGATKTKPGRLELADGGTVFFDELGELPVALQAKLLRVLQTREVERLGDVRVRKIDVRFLAATNRVISEMIEKGTFREDLYYRLKVIELTMPPLRDRKEDIAELAEAFLTKYAGEGSRPALSRGALDVLEQYPWPGNVRELENVIHRSVVLAKGETIDAADLPEELREQSAKSPAVALGKTLPAAEEEFRRQYIIKTLRETASVAEAARVLGINRTHFYKLLSQLGIEY